MPAAVEEAKTAKAAPGLADKQEAAVAFKASVHKAVTEWGDKQRAATEAEKNEMLAAAEEATRYGAGRNTVPVRPSLHRRSYPEDGPPGSWEMHASRLES